jgi:hypothetical protein
MMSHEVSGVTLVRLESDKIAEGRDDYDYAGLMCSSARSDSD